MPIRLISFDAEPIEKNRVQINWSTLSENNNDYFTLERSQDSLNFEQILKVESAHFSENKIDYRVIDSTAYNGHSYYRLKQTDYNGKFTYSRIIDVNFSSTDAEEFVVFPNPVTDISEISFLAEKPGPAIICATDILGKVIFTQQVNCDKGRNNVKLDLAGAKQGIYIISFSSDTESYVSTVIKQ